jgi:hypothetical protein
VQVPGGLEHPPENTKKKPISQTSGAKSGALSAKSAPIDTELQNLIDAWATLPEAIRAGILAMVRATCG